MVLITPYRPIVANPTQVQPTNVSGKLGKAGSRGTMATVVTEALTTVYEGEFSVTNNSEHPWQFYNNAFDAAKMSMALTTLNGYNAIAVTWDTTCSGGERWGGHINLPDAYEEVYFTHDIMFGPYWSKRGQKLPGFDEVGSTWTAQLMSSGRDSPSGFYKQSAEAGDVPLRQYWYDLNNGPQSNHWDPPHIPQNTVARIKQRFKLNSAGNADGIYQCWWDVGTSMAHAEPVTLRSSMTNRQWYGGSETRADSLVDGIVFLLFFGGPNVSSNWFPLIDSTVTLGYFKVEVPA